MNCCQNNDNENNTNNNECQMKPSLSPLWTFRLWDIISSIYLPLIRNKLSILQLLKHIPIPHIVIPSIYSTSNNNMNEQSKNENFEDNNITNGNNMNRYESAYIIDDSQIFNIIYSILNISMNIPLDIINIHIQYLVLLSIEGLQKSYNYFKQIYNTTTKNIINSTTTNFINTSNKVDITFIQNIISKCIECILQCSHNAIDNNNIINSDSIITNLTRHFNIIIPLLLEVC
jgi:hypothetical protein